MLGPKSSTAKAFLFPRFFARAYAVFGPEQSEIRDCYRHGSQPRAFYFLPVPAQGAQVFSHDNKKIH